MKKLLFITILLSTFFSCKKTILSPEVLDDEIDFLTIQDELEKQIKPYKIDNQYEDSMRKMEIPKYFKKEKAKKFNLLHTQLRLSLDWEKQHLFGVATLAITPHRYPQDSVVIDARGFEINEIYVLTKNKNQKIDYKYNNKKITIHLPHKAAFKDTLKIKIDYIAKPNELKEEKREAIKSSKGLFFINPLLKEPYKPRQLWTQGETEYNSSWVPTFDTPNQKTTQEIWIEVDSVYETLSNGILISSTFKNGKRIDYWKQTQPHAPYLMMIAVGDFAVIKDKFKDLPLYYYFEPNLKEEGMETFKNTPEMIDYFSKLFNYPFPWGKYAQIVVRDYVSGAMENTSASVFMEEVILEHQELIDKDWDEIIAHELMHQWFGDLVTIESWSQLPLNESFATYAEYLWKEHKNGIEEADIHWDTNFKSYLRESIQKNEKLIRHYYADEQDMFDSHSYQKGSLILHRLRKIVGDEVFFHALHKYLKIYAFQTVEIHQLRLVFEKITGRDLKWFFKQWFDTPGHPILNIQDTIREGKTYIKVKQKNSVNYNMVYQIPIHIDIWEGGKKKTYFKIIDEPVEEFEFETTQADLIVIGAQDYIPGEINHIKSDKKFMLQFDRYKSVLPRLQSIEKLLKKNADKEVSNTTKEPTEMTDFFSKLLKEAFPFYRKIGIEYFTSVATDTHHPAIYELAKKDKNSSVRMEALLALNPLKEESIQLFNTSLKDSSFMVKVASLVQLIRGGKAEGDILPIVEKFESMNNFYMVMVLMNFYVEKKVPNKTDWFIEKMHRLSNNEKKYLINYLDYYALMQETPQREKIINYYKEFMPEHQLKTE